MWAATVWALPQQKQALMEVIDCHHYNSETALGGGGFFVVAVDLKSVNLEKIILHFKLVFFFFVFFFESDLLC
jgi:hypothetical protein